MTRPCRFSTIRSAPRRATTRTVSASMAASRSSASTIRPSALLTIFEVTSRTSPSSEPGLGARRSASRGRRPGAPRAARAAAQTRYAGTVSPAGRVDPRHARTSSASASASRAIVARSRPRRSSSAARPGSGCPPSSTSLDGARVHRVDEPAVEQPASRSAAATAAAVDSTPTAASTLSAMPRTGASPTMGERPDDGHPGLGDGLADAGHGEDRADADRRGWTAGRG